MAKKKRANKKSRAARRARPQRQPKAAASAILSMAMQACSVTNPFCPEAIAARWPDNSYTKSVGWSMTAFQVTLANGASSTVSRMYFPDYVLTGLDPSTYAYPSITWNATGGSAFSVPSNVARWRITSWGMRIGVTTSLLNTQGMLRVRLFSPLNGSTLGTTSATSNMADAEVDLPLARLVEHDVFVIPAPLGINARLFNDARSNTTLATWVNPGWQVVQITLDGLPVVAGSGSVNIGLFYNFEFVFADGDASTAFCQPPPADNPIVRKANATVFERVGNFVEGAADKVDKLFQSKALKYITAAVGGAMGGPAGAATGFALGAGVSRPAIMDVD